MGSNPISPNLVADTSTLQGLHRGGALEVLRERGFSLSVPEAVAGETREYFSRIGAARVPDLDSAPWIQRVVMSDAELAASGATLVGSRRGTTEHLWRGRRVQRPELEAILLAKREGATLVIEDARAVRCAELATVPIANVATVLRDLARGGAFSIEEAARRAKAILATGYSGKELEWLSRGIDDF